MTSRKNWPLGASSCILKNFKGHTDNGFAHYKEAGIKYAELSLCDSELEKLNFYDNPEKLSELAKRNGVEFCSFHIPFSETLHPANLNEKENKCAMVKIEKAIRAAIKIGIKTMVIHPSGEPNDDDTMLEKMQRSIENLRYLAGICEENGAKLAVENLPRTCLGNSSFDILTYLNEIPSLDLCFDTNHLTMQTNEDFLDDLLQFGMHGRIRTVHISDYDFLDERHRLPGDGINDWETIIQKLEELCYDGVFMYEVSKPFEREAVSPMHVRKNFESII